MSVIPASDIVHAGADGLTRKVAENIELNMIVRTRDPSPFIPDVKPDVKLLIDQQAAKELAWQRDVENYTPDRGGPQSYAEFQQNLTRVPEAPTPTKPAAPAPFDAAKAARRILDDLGSPMWDLHDKTLP